MSPNTTSPATPKHIAEVAAYARRHGWTADVAWSPATPDNDGEGFVVSITGDTARGSGKLHLEWRRLKGSNTLAFQRWLSQGWPPAGGWRHPLTLADARSVVRTSPIPRPDGVRPERSWRAPDALPVTVDDLTDNMLAYARKAADSSGCPYTVWPSRFVGREFSLGTDLVVLGNFYDDDAPEGAAPNSRPLLTILPATYFRR